MQQVEALFAALGTQLGVGQRIQEAQLSLGTPCDNWSIREVMNHSIGVTLKFADFAAGATDRPQAPEGDLVGLDHVVALRTSANTARAAWETADTTRSCELPFGSFSAEVAAGINLFDVLAHTWDVATPAAVDFDCADDLWLVGLDAARTVIGTARDSRQYAPELPAPPSAGPRERLLRFLGRLG